MYNFLILDIKDVLLDRIEQLIYNFLILDIKDVLLDRIEHEYLLYCSNLVLNCMLLSCHVQASE